MRTKYIKIAVFFLCTICFILGIRDASQENEKQEDLYCNSDKNIEILSEVDIHNIKAGYDRIVYTTGTDETEMFYLFDKEHGKSFFSINLKQDDILDYEIYNSNSIIVMMIDEEEGKENIVLQKVNFNGEISRITLLDSFYKGEKDNCYAWRLAVSTTNVLVYSNLGYVLYDFNGNVLAEKVYEEKKSCEFCMTDENIIVNTFVNGKRQVLIYDIKTGKTKDISDNFVNTIMFAMKRLDNSTFSIITDNQLYFWEKEKKECVPYLNWSDYGITASDILCINQGEEGEIRCIYRNDELVWKCTINAGESNERQRIVLACLGETTELQKRVTTFNSEHPEYVLEICNYKQQYGEDAVTVLYNHLLSGEGPDIISVDVENMNYYHMVNSGMLEDLTQYIEKSSVIKPQEIISSIRELMKIDEKTYALPTNFGLSTLIVNNKYFSSREQWTIENAIDLLKQYPELKPSGITQNVMLSLGSVYKFSERRDATDEEIKDEINDFLCLANLFPRKAVYVPEDAAYRTGKVLFSVETFQSMKDYLHHMFLWGDYGTCLGYMGVDGNGTAIIPINTLAISSKSDNKEIAWQYIESHFSIKWQNNNITPNWDFSIMEEILDEQLNGFLRENLVDENGQDIPIEDAVL